MSNIIKIKNSDKSGGEPLANSLSYGELAINYRDGKIFFKDHLGGIGYFQGTTSDTFVNPGFVDTAPSDSEVLSWMNV
jgi:hypothetical protein